METNRLLEYDRLGRTHWWLTSKYVILHDLLCKQVPRGTRLTPMLDVGCASGVFLNKISNLVPQQFGVDYNYDILTHCMDPSVPVTVADAKQLPYRDGSFSLVSAIDILEHLDDDAQALREFHRLLRPGGWLLLCVPAFMALFGKHDELFGHHRRYTRKQLQKRVCTTGFFIKKITYIQPLFFFPLWIKRRFLPVKNNLFGDFSPPSPAVNRILHALLSAERFPLRYISFPIGATLILLAYKDN